MVIKSTHDWAELALLGQGVAGLVVSCSAMDSSPYPGQNNVDTVLPGQAVGRHLAPVATLETLPAGSAGDTTSRSVSDGLRTILQS